MLIVVLVIDISDDDDCPNCRAHEGEKEKGELEGGVWRNLRGGERWLRWNGVIQSATCCTMCKSDWLGIWHERFQNVGRVLFRHPGRGYTGGQRSPTLVDGLPSGHPFSRLIRQAGIRCTYSTPTHRDILIMTRSKCVLEDFKKVIIFCRSKVIRWTLRFELILSLMNSSFVYLKF